MIKNEKGFAELVRRLEEVLGLKGTVTPKGGQGTNMGIIFSSPTGVALFEVQATWHDKSSLNIRSRWAVVGVLHLIGVHHPVWGMEVLDEEV